MNRTPTSNNQRSAPGRPPTPGRPAEPHRLDGPLLRPEQAAALLSVKTSWIYDAVRTGKLPCVRIGRYIRFTREMLEEYLNSR